MRCWAARAAAPTSASGMASCRQCVGPAERGCCVALIPLQRRQNDATSIFPLRSLAHSLSWSVQRDLPLPSERGGPRCTPGISVPLAPASRRQLAALLRGEASEAQLLRDEGAGGEAGSAALHPLVWLLRGDLCSSSPLQLRDVPSGPADPVWSAWMACNASLLPSSQPAPPDMLLPGASLGGGASMAQQRRLAATAALGRVGSSTADWWRLGCWAVNASGDPLPPPAEAQGTAECGSGFAGPRWVACGACAGCAACQQVVLLMPYLCTVRASPSPFPTRACADCRLVAVLERVQGGILGATLSRYGVAGLCECAVQGAQVARAAAGLQAAF